MTNRQKARFAWKKGDLTEVTPKSKKKKKGLKEIDFIPTLKRIIEDAFSGRIKSI